MIFMLSTVILSVLCAALLFWVIHLKWQIHSISRQLEKRLSDGSQNSIYVSLFDRDAVRLTADINRCFSEDENAKRTLEREEKHFRNTIANISHDLRTPLTSIKGYLQLLEATPLSELQQKRVGVINRHVNELGDLIEHFFEYSYLLSNDSELLPERFCLTDEVTECLAAAVPQFEDKGMAVHLEEFAQVNVIADREKTVRMIQNLVRNCIQHSSGDISVSVESVKNTAEHTDCTRITFSNPVKAPDEIDIGSIFDRFYTSDKSSRKSTGLGLSIVKILAEQMGGRAFAVLHGNIISIGVELPSIYNA